MNKEIKCPKKNLERFLLLLNEINFEALGQEPSIEDAIILATLTNQDEKEEEIPKEDINKAYRRAIRRKIKQRRGAEELSYYGRTQKEISENLRKHANKCYNCFERYIQFILKEAIMNLKESEEIISDNANYPQEILECARKEINQGLPALLRQEDERYLGLLIKI